MKIKRLFFIIKQRIVNDELEEERALMTFIVIILRKFHFYIKTSKKLEACN